MIEFEFGFVVAISAAIVAGGIQRITGMGFALCATPVLVAIYGASEGVRLVVFLGALASVFLLLRMWPLVDWRVAWQLIWPALAISPVAALVILVLPEPVLLLIVGAAAVLSLVAVKAPRLAVALVGGGASVKTGALAALLNLSSGLSGPPLLGYAEFVRMPQVTFLASVQVVFIALDSLTMLWRGLPTIPAVDTLVLVFAVAAGVAVASLTVKYIPQRVARTLMFIVAWVGTILVIAKGILALL